MSKFITEDYVSLELAKLLKEKGFDIPCRQYLTQDGRIWFCSGSDLMDGSGDWNSASMGYTSIPTLQMAMKWLREVHKIAIDLFSVGYIDASYSTIGYRSTTIQLPTAKVRHSNVLFDNSPKTYKEAAEEAIRQGLTLI